MEKTREPKQRSASVEQDARQPRLAMEADVITDTKTRKRTEGAAAAERVISGDNSSAQVDTVPIRLTSFGDDSTGPPAFPCSRDDALRDKGAAAPKPCLSPAKMRTRTAADGLLPAGTAPTAMKAILSRPRPSWTLGGKAKESTSRTNNNQLGLPYWRKVIQTKSKQTLVFDPGGCTGPSTQLPVSGRVTRVAYSMGSFGRCNAGSRGWSVFSRRRTSEYHFPERGTSNSYVLRSIAVFSTARLV